MLDLERDLGTQFPKNKSCYGQQWEYVYVPVLVRCPGCGRFIVTMHDIADLSRPGVVHDSIHCAACGCRATYKLDLESRTGIDVTIEQGDSDE